MGDRKQARWPDACVSVPEGIGIGRCSGVSAGRRDNVEEEKCEYNKHVAMQCHCHCMCGSLSMSV